MKPKLFVLVVLLLLVAMVPALASAKSQAKPQRTGQVALNLNRPLGPQLDAQLGVTSRGARAINAPGEFARRGANGPLPQAVYGLLNDSFEAPWPASPNWVFLEAGASPVGWDATAYKAKRGNQSLYSAGYNNDPFLWPYYDNDMESYAFYVMDLQGARRVQVRFQYMNDTEFAYDYFLWCSSDDGSNFLCDYHTGSTNNTWRLVTLDSKTSPIMSDLLNEPFAYFGYIFISDGSIVDTGTFVDVLRIRAWGP
jgi:hypothetical protein